MNELFEQLCGCRTLEAVIEVYKYRVAHAPTPEHKANEQLNLDGYIEELENTKK